MGAGDVIMGAGYVFIFDYGGGVGSFAEDYFYICTCSSIEQMPLSFPGVQHIK